MPFTRALTKSLKYAGIWGLCGAKWIKMGAYGALVPLHIYLNRYNTIRIDSKLIVIIFYSMTIYTVK
jgi:hypothetical protein